MKSCLAYITQRLPGEFILNISDDEGLKRFELNEDQLGNIVADGAKWLYHSRIRKLESTETQR